jgi:RNA-binding protein Musashi
MVDKNTQRSRGFGFVTFLFEDSVEQVMLENDSHQLNGKWIDCKKALPVSSVVL